MRAGSSSWYFHTKFVDLSMTNKIKAWEDMSIVLNKADQTFGKTTDWLYKATGGKMSTPDGGKTWNFTTLSIPETKFS